MDPTEEPIPSNNKKNPRAKDQKIFEFIKAQGRPVSFYEIQQGINMSSGAVQAAIARCLKKNSKFKIYEGNQLSDRSNRIIRVFSDSAENLGETTFDFWSLLETKQSMMDGKILTGPDGKSKILPLQIPQELYYILEYTNNIKKEYISIGNFIGKAITSYLAKELSTEEIQTARTYSLSRIKSNKKQ